MASESAFIDIDSNTPSLVELVEEVERTHQPRPITRANTVVAVITPVRPGSQEATERFFRVVDRIQERNRDVDPDEVYRDVAETVGEVRREG